MVQLYNTMTRSIDEFIPLEDKKVSLYTCGPTVYNFAHIGNLRTYVFEDILKRVLVHSGFSVNHVMNVTDVGHLVSDADTGEDKMEVGARREKKTVWELAEYYYQSFRKNMSDLNILEPDVWCKATDHIQEQIDAVQQLEAKGYTYTLEDGIYFDTAKLNDYGRLTGQDLRKLKGGARIEMVEGKRNATDFALWKFSPRDQKRLMEWDSPWGIGFPGWHIECSAMATRYLGEQIDIHCGGIDHIAVHHTNEIAQAESLTEKEWVRWWMHGEFLVLGKQDGDGDKMSKSGANFITLDTVIERGYDPLVYRYFCLNAHYRTPLTFTWEALDGAARGLDRLKNNILQLKKQANPDAVVSESHYDAFTSAARDDLNMPVAMATMWKTIKDNNLSPESRYATLLEMDKILGLGFEDMKEETVELGGEVNELVKKRDEARKNRDFAEADRLRDQIIAIGYVLEDTLEGTRVKKAE